MSSARRKTKRGAGDTPSRPSEPKRSRAGAKDNTNEKGQVEPVCADLSFEAALTQLQAVVDRLEGGELELEAAVEAFAEGARLTQRCSEALSAAERRIEVLAEQGGEWLTRPFDLQEGTLQDGTLQEGAEDGSDESTAQDDEDFGDDDDWEEEES